MNRIISFLTFISAACLLLTSCATPEANARLEDRMDRRENAIGKRLDRMEIREDSWNRRLDGMREREEINKQRRWDARFGEF